MRGEKGTVSFQSSSKQPLSSLAANPAPHSQSQVPSVVKFACSVTAMHGAHVNASIEHCSSSPIAQRLRSHGTHNTADEFVGSATVISPIGHPPPSPAIWIPSTLSP